MDDLLKRLAKLSTIGNEVKFYHKDKQQEYYTLGKVVDEVSVISTDNPEYKIFIQKIKGSDGNIGYRICYYVINRKKTGIVFGQYACVLNEHDFEELIKKAREKFLGEKSL